MFPSTTTTSTTTTSTTYTTTTTTPKEEEDLDKILEEALKVAADNQEIEKILDKALDEMQASPMAALLTTTTPCISEQEQLHLAQEVLLLKHTLQSWIAIYRQDRGAFQFTAKTVLGMLLGSEVSPMIQGVFSEEKLQEEWDSTRSAYAEQGDACFEINGSASYSPQALELLNQRIESFKACMKEQQSNPVPPQAFRDLFLVSKQELDQLQENLKGQPQQSLLTSAAQGIPLLLQGLGVDEQEREKVNLKAFGYEDMMEAMICALIENETLLHDFANLTMLVIQKSSFSIQTCIDILKEDSMQPLKDSFVRKLTSMAAV